MILEISGKLSPKDVIIRGRNLPKVEFPSNDEKNIKTKKSISNEDITYGYPFDKVFIALLYDMLVDECFIEKMDYLSFQYYFNNTCPCPTHLEKIHWLEASREGVTVLLEMIFDKFDRFRSDKRIKKGDWWREMERLTPLIWNDMNGKPLTIYKKSGGYSRNAALKMKDNLVKLFDIYDSEKQIFT